MFDIYNICKATILKILVSRPLSSLKIIMHIKELVLGLCLVIFTVTEIKIAKVIICINVLRTTIKPTAY